MADDGDDVYAGHEPPFLQTANINIFVSSRLESLHFIWSSEFLLYAQALAIPLAFWIKPLCVCFALFWLTYRAFNVLNKPLDELAFLLGFDVPLVPNVALAGLKSDGAIVYWSLPSKQRSKNSFRYELLLDGAVVGSVPVHEEAVIISGLRPDTFYIVRVAVVQGQEFSTKSAALRFRTKPAASNDAFHQSSAHDAETDTTNSPLVRVQPYRGLKDIANAASSHSVAATNAVIGRKRSSTNWRNATALTNGDGRNEIGQQQQEEGIEAIDDLTERLDQLRREHDEAEKQAREEEEEEQKQRDDLIRERDDLRTELAERERTSRNLKREVNLMERQNTAAQNERSKLERQLQQKLHDRLKLKEDAVRWADEAVVLHRQAHAISEEREAYKQRAAQDKLALQGKLTAELASIKALDDDIRETTAEIKKTERAAKDGSPNSDGHVSLVEQFQQDAEEDRQHNLRKLELQNQYAAAVQRLEQAKRFYLNNMQYLEGLKERRQREEVVVAAAASTRDLVTFSDRLPVRKDSQSSRRNGAVSHDSPRPGVFSPVSASSLGSGVAAPVFAAGSVFAFGNGMASSAADSNGPDDYRERLTGGALLSPEAGEGLIPADLFATEDRPSNVQPLPGLGALPGVLTRLGQTAQDHQDPGPASPASISSRAASAFASPQASQQNLSFNLSSPEGFVDPDGRSIRSNLSGMANSSTNTGSRFSAMFGLRQRAKNTSLGNSTSGAPLGRFNSRSMPRQDQGLFGLDNAARKRNSSLSGNVFTAAEDESEADDDVPTQVRKRPFTLNPFSKDKAGDGWPSSFSPFSKRPVSPRPLSTHSGELPRPSFDSSRWGADAWQAGETTNGARASPLSLGGWSMPGTQSRAFNSRHASRRASTQYGISDQPEDIMEDDADIIIEPESEQRLAPIGTKPQALDKKSAKQNDVKLNPNAKDFKSFLSSMRLRDREKSRGTGEGSSAKVGMSSTDAGSPHLGEQGSPSQSRASRDARSTTTMDSPSSESRRPSAELVLAPTSSNLEAAASPQILSGSATGKESFMQKITRKSSSNKFSLPTFKRDKPRLDRDTSITASPNVPPAEDDEDDMSASVSSLKESRESSEKPRPSARSWSTVLKLGKKKADTETPSVSELSMTSGATGDEELEDR